MVIKNIDCPGGRKDWKGRLPRWRISLSQGQLLILKECMEVLFNKYSEKRLDSNYDELYERLNNAIIQMESPLMMPDKLNFEEDWSFDEI